MRVGNILTSIARSKLGESVFKKLSEPRNQANVTNALLTADTIASTASYMYFTQQQERIDDESKFAMQVQHVLSAVLSIAICTPINKKIGIFAEEVGKRINKGIIDSHKIASGISILLPTCTVLLMNRMTLPAVLTPVSSNVRDYLKKKHGKKLDTEA